MITLIGVFTFASKQRQVSSFAENASKVIFQQAVGKGALSEIIKNASEAVFGAAVNCILSVNTSQTHEQVRQKWDILEKIMGRKFNGTRQG